MKKEKKDKKLSSKEIDSLLSKRAEKFIYDEMKKSIMNNPALMSQLTQAAKSLEKAGVEID